MRMRWRRSSAAVILLTLASLSWTQAQKKDKVEKVTKKSTTEKPKLIPGKQSARVTSTPQSLQFRPVHICEAQDPERKQELAKKKVLFKILNNFLYLEFLI